MLITTTDLIPGRNYEILGMVQGSVVQSKHIGKDLGASFKTIVGGELRAYTEMLEESRNMATSRMVEEAKRLNADAIIAVRYASSAIMQGASEYLAYGTAVRFL
ncbi:MAG: YbjQ family protein [Clostridiales bacterium]|nr:YbjQ family protein [Clostridiales bacterium]